MTGPHDEWDDYADDPGRPYRWLDRMFVGILPIHFVFLVLVPCWWPLAPASLGWAALGLLACRHPVARRNAVILFVIAAGQLVAVVAYVLADFASRKVLP